ncbi:glycosyltransferase family 2 protein [Halothiobacillus neapolitanus]|uniref:Glycosyl transferase family 2 n=1 Tax=Halothiobacillus neapolitanus (strain ATCC 23641 / DSM 15147 / CIP 104769 / NCIMB 8539 / c2) TaxID=555778 RepID=D0L0V1_HALNC|nr:glycosyltransferase family 2 protein [Halothiobacillus neapolitanus]ACX96324.1 glycosyl transferase family 2 [Halothiobacillus neapolitanus c2]TDN66636.1 GT2 family glycosyltransferase [Halothiobacillus neapolitanus]
MSQEELNRLHHENARQQAEIIHLTALLNEQRAKMVRIYGSRSWRYTQFLRSIDGLIHKYLLGSTRIDLVPIHQLELNNTPKGKVWVSTGEDPQFLIRAHNPAVLKQTGWAQLEFQLRCDEPLPMQLFIDYGQGYKDDIVINHHADTSGLIQIPLYIPVELLDIRFDPAAHPTEFKISGVRLKRLKHPPANQDSANQGAYSHLASIADIGFHLEASNQITRSLTDSRHWLSHGEDPYFTLQYKNTQALKPGWHCAKLNITTEAQKGIAKFYFDTGSGYNEAQTLAIPFESGMLIERVIYCKETIKTIRFDPIDFKGGFKLEALDFKSIDTTQAEETMRHRIAEQHPDFVGTSPAEFEQRLDEVIRAMQPDATTPKTDTLITLYNQTFDTRPGAIAYDQWIEQVEQAQLPTQATVQAFLSSQSTPVIISIVMPVYNTPEKYLRLCIDSVRAQSYPHWELCIADDKSPQPHVKKVLDEYIKKDKRIKVVYRPQNGHISKASNSALKLATGEYVALLDHDDALPEHALYFMAQAIAEHPEAQILYSDEDKIDIHGQRSEPHFKSDWNPDLFYSQNYVSHLGVYKRELLQRINGFRTGVEGSQDQDLLLRCLPHVKAEQIIHIPKILYHWRTLEGSTAMASGEKSYTTDAGIKALSDFFEKNGPAGIKIEQGLVPNTYRVHWPIPNPAPLVSLLIPTRDRKTITEIAVRSILDKTTYPNYEIIILDNGSEEPETLDWFAAIQQEDERVKVLRYDHPFNYSAINNFGAQHAKGSLIGLINNDVEVISPDWLTEMVSHALREDIGCVGAKLYYSNDTLQHAGVILGIGGVANHSHKNSKRDSPGYFARLIVAQNFSAVTAACLIIRKSVYDQVGGLDEVNLKVAFNDVDFCLKVREAGYRNLWTPYAELYHHESISRGTEDSPEKQARFRGEVEFMQSKWGDALKLDPFYSPNLTQDREDFSIGN